ncbi:methionine adenosyltransferase [Listeria sp. PSOL-1]|uniref:methionine adenosyltransferase n=1 Tax=Listeria sp. PSOL-1 TaxID=1844999 RepID=UPI0013D1162E|nr:methionine adenosyltransferase [Listeria sp. PSOL-1]
MNIFYDNNLILPSDSAYEVVERKGLGHPDTLADGLAEATELAYCQYCLDHFGVILHHNLDKLMILGGLSQQVYGGEAFSKPIRVVFMGRASTSYNGEPIPLFEIQKKAAQDYLARILPHLDVNDPNMIQFESLTSDRSTRENWFSPQSLEDLPEYKENPVANDTAAMISYWPLTIAEQLALKIEGYFYRDNESGLPEPRFKDIGQDIKVMVIRNDNCYNVTVALPLVTTLTKSKEAYMARLDEMENEIREYIADAFPSEDIKIIVNTVKDKKERRFYMVTAGSAIDFGEEGAVGRGNKTHGVIASLRPNTMEAPQGKNPTYFVGKVLGYATDQLAKKIYEETKQPCVVVMEVNNGDPLFSPSKIIISTKAEIDQKKVDALVESIFSEGRKITSHIVSSKYFLPRTDTFKLGGK